MTTITKIIKITNGRKRELVDEVGDLAGMVTVAPYATVIQGRNATIQEWYDEDSFDGYEIHTVTLMDGEI